MLGFLKHFLHKYQSGCKYIAQWKVNICRLGLAVTNLILRTSVSLNLYRCRAGAIETSELSFGCGDTGRKVDASVSKTPSKDPS